MSILPASQGGTCLSFSQVLLFSVTTMFGLSQQSYVTTPSAMFLCYSYPFVLSWRQETKKNRFQYVLEIFFLYLVNFSRGDVIREGEVPLQFKGAQRMGCA